MIKNTETILYLKGKEDTNTAFESLYISMIIFNSKWNEGSIKKIL